jgi:hypothetical protein
MTRDDDRRERDHEADHEPDENADDVTRRAAGAEDAVGATAGAHAGAVAGAAAGPAGVLAGGALGGLAGWLAGRRARDPQELSSADDAFYRELHERTTDTRKMPYEHVRDLYSLGHHLADHPEFGDRQWRDIEPELREAWTIAQRETWGEWPRASDYVRRGFEQGRGDGRGTPPRS